MGISSFFTLDSILGFVNQGLMYAIMAYGIYITYKILDFPDLTVDGSFPLGAAVTATLLVSGVNPWLALLASFCVGVLAGICTGLIHVKCKVRDLLSGIIMMTGLYSINLQIAGKANVPLFGTDTLFESAFMDSIFPASVGSNVRKLIILLLIAGICKIALDLYLKTRSGFLLRAVGDNHALVTSLAKNKGTVKIIGLAIANGLVAMSGSVIANEQGFFDISMGTGTMVIGLASVILGTNLLNKFSFVKGTTAAIVGSVIYRAAWYFAITLGLDATLMKLVTAVLLLIFLVISMERKKKPRNKMRKEAA